MVFKDFEFVCYELVEFMVFVWVMSYVGVECYVFRFVDKKFV